MISIKPSFLIILLILVPQYLKAQPVVVLAGSYIDVVTGKQVQPAVITIENGLIAAVNPDQVPNDATTIDLGDAVLLPGLMDMHVHLSSQLSADRQLRSVTETDQDRTLQGAYFAKKTLMAGFTTVRDLGAGGFINVALSKATDAGYSEGPRIVPAGHALSITGGHGDASGFAPGILEGGFEEGVADGADEVQKAVRYQIKHGAKVIKIFATAGVLSFEEALGAQQFTFEEIKAAVEEAGRHGMKVAAHGHGEEGILEAVQAGVASIEHGSILSDEIIAAMLERGTYLVPTTVLTDDVNLDVLPPLLRSKAERVIPMAQASTQKAIEAGVNIAFGTDAAVIPHGTNAREFSALVSRGMTPLAAIQSATLNAADLLGVTDRGQIHEGMLADLIAVETNPLEDIETLEAVTFVMKGGVVYKGMP